MTDRIDFGGEPWGAIPRSTMRDPRLTHKAKGGLVTLLSHDDGWVRSCIAILQREGRCGRKQAQAIMAELRELGYAELIQERGTDNLIVTRYVVRAIPVSVGSEQVSLAELTYREPSRPDSGPPGLRSAVVEALDVEPLDEEPQVRELAPRKRDAIWDVLVAIYGEPTTSGRGAMNAACKTLKDYGATTEDIAWVVRELGNTDLNWAVTTPSSLAKHFGERNALVAQLDRPRVYDHAAAISEGTV